MRTSLNEVKQLENWLLKQGDPQERLLTEVKILTNTEWKDKADHQRMAYQLVYQYGRAKLREEIRDVEYRLFNAPKHKTFQDRIRSIFKH
jgi:hypothetical protein